MPVEVGVMPLRSASADGTFNVHGLSTHPRLAEVWQPGLPRQSTTFRAVDPGPQYRERAVTELGLACIDLGLPRDYVAFIEHVGPRGGPGFGGGVTDYPGLEETILIVVDRTPIDLLRRRVRHEAAHLACRTRHPEHTDQHSGPSEEEAEAFELT
jgi:hypothetical protein